MTVVRPKQKIMRDLGVERLPAGFAWEKKDLPNILFVSNDAELARDFAHFAKTLSVHVSYLWSLEGLDFLPLPRVTAAVITADRWHAHEIFGRPVNATLQSLPKIIVLLKSGDSIPGGKTLRDNVEYVFGSEDMQDRVRQAVTEARRDTEHSPPHH